MADNLTVICIPLWGFVALSMPHSLNFFQLNVFSLSSNMAHVA